MTFPTELDLVFEALAAASIKGTSAYIGAYQEHFRILQPLEKSRRLRVGEIRAIEAGSSLQLIKVGAVLNDLSFLSFPMRGSLNLHWLTGDGIKKLLGIEALTLWYREPIPPAFASALATGQVTVGFGMADDRAAIDALNQSRPLIEARLIIPRPTRVMIYLAETKPDGSRVWGTIEAKSRGGPDEWDITSSPDLNARRENLALDQSPPNPDERRLCEVLLPFVENVSARDLASILQDEADVLAEFRAGIRLLINEATQQGRNQSEIIHDVILPRTAALERRFRHIVNKTRLKLSGATLATATLSLVSLVDTGLGAAVLALGGAAGGGAFVREYVSGSTQLAALKSDLTYLMWKLTRVRT
jgi:hypothetical protein